MGSSLWLSSGRSVKDPISDGERLSWTEVTLHSFIDSFIARTPPELGLYTYEGAPASYDFTPFISMISPDDRDNVHLGFGLIPLIVKKLVFKNPFRSSIYYDITPAPSPFPLPPQEPLLFASFKSKKSEPPAVIEARVTQNNVISTEYSGYYFNPDWSGSIIIEGFWSRSSGDEYIISFLPAFDSVPMPYLCVLFNKIKHLLPLTTLEAKSPYQYTCVKELGPEHFLGDDYYEGYTCKINAGLLFK